MPSPVIETLNQYHRALDARDAAAVARLTRNYSASLKRLQAMLDSLILEIGDKPPTRGQLVRMARYKALIEQIERELVGLQVATANEITSTAAESAGLGASAAADLITATLTGETVASVSAGFNALPRAAVEAITGFLDPSGPLFARLNLLAPFVADLVADAIIQGVTLGFNPRKIARMLQDAFGNGLTDALRFVRTAQLWAYRAANHEVYRENSDVVTGWVWCASLSGRTCMSCIAMHGTIHPIEETLADHHNGRCSAIALVKNYPNPVEETGVDWFSRQPEAVQRKMMGREFFDAWRGGAFDLADMTTEHTDSVYGPMRVRRPLWDLLGAEPPIRMQSQEHVR